MPNRRKLRSKDHVSLPAQDLSADQVCVCFQILDAAGRAVVTNYVLGALISEIYGTKTVQRMTQDSVYNVTDLARKLDNRLKDVEAHPAMRGLAPQS